MAEYKFLCLNLFFKFLPAPEYPDLESATILVEIKLFLIKGIRGIKKRKRENF